MSILIELKVQDQACQAGQSIHVQGSKMRGDITLQQADGVFVDAIEITLQGMSRWLADSMINIDGIEGNCRTTIALPDMLNLGPMLMGQNDHPVSPQGHIISGTRLIVPPSYLI
jgi:hypothetical protein